MNILIVDPMSLIPALKYGGTERVIFDLGKALVSLGHKVTFLVKKGSTCSFATIIPYDNNKEFESQVPNDIDIIHFHSIYIETKYPYIYTLHGNLENDTDFLNENTVFISKRHAELYGSENYVYNGLDWSNYNVNLNLPRKGYHFLGKARWKVKNLNGAIDIVHKAKENLEVLGGKKWNFRNLKTNTLKKLSNRITFHGFVDNSYKIRVCNQSKGLIFPVLWEEPFGLAIIESLYCGAPVFGTPYGALKELIISEVGYTSTKVDDIVNCLNSKEFSSKVCHEYAQDNFNSKIMAENYLEKYNRVLNKESLHNTKLKRQIKKTSYTFN